MTDDPFARFERSRSGLLIPVVIFVIGALVTLVSMELIGLVDMAEQRRELETKDDRPHNDSAEPVIPNREE